jgi:flagellar motor switch protein FliN
MNEIDTQRTQPDALADGSTAARGPVSQAPAVHPVQFGQLPEREERTIPPENLDLVLDVPLRLNVELGRATMSIAEILGLAPGSIIELDKLAGEPVDIVVNDRVIAKGEVVVVDENFGVRLTDIVSPAKRAASLS